MSNEWKMMKLEDVCDKQSSNIAQNKVIDITGDYQLFGASGYIKNINFYKQENEYVAIVKDGAGVGRVMKLPAKSSVLGTLQYIVPKDNININYLYYSLLGMNLAKYASGATIPHIYFKNYCNESVFLPSKDKQQEIAGLLDKARELLEKHKVQLAELDLLAESVFYDMFGDPVTNEKGWDVKQLGELGGFKNGLNFDKSETAHPIKILGVSDFKNYSYISDASSLGKIYTSTMIKDDYLLKDGDFIFVRSNGSKELVGRCIVVCFGNEVVTFSGFCIRFRKNTSSITSKYLISILSNQNFRKQWLNKGRGCSINNLNQGMLSFLKIQIPPLDLQNKFSEIIEKIEQQKSQVRKALKESEDLFQRLMQDMFNPEYHNK